MRYRHEWPGFILLASLTLLLGALLAWGDHFLSPGPTGGIKRLLQLWAASRPAPEPAPTLSTLATPTPNGASSAAPPEDHAPVTGPADPVAAAPVTLALPADTPPATAPRPRTQARYALDLGSFALAEEAERAEAQLNQAGFSTVRFRQEESLRLFSVFVPVQSEGEDGQVVAGKLRDGGFAQAVVVGGAEGPKVRVGEALPLRIAVRTAERLRAAGHQPRVSAESPRGGWITLRHGNFTSKEEAEAVGREISRLGVVAEVVQIR